MLSVLKNFNSSFLCFIATTTLSSITLNCIRFGISWLVMEQTASITAFVSIFSISSLIEFYGKPLLAPIADYFDRLTVYKVCIALAAVCVGALIFIVMYIKFSIYLLMGPLLLLSAIAALRDPASAGLVPVLVDSEYLIKAQSLRSSIGSVISLGAPMFSALLLSMGGSKIALITAGIASVVSLFFTLGIRQIQEEIIVPKSWGEYVKTWHFRTINGLRAVFMTRSERVTAIVVAITNAGLFPFFFVVLPLWVKHSMAGTAYTMAVIEVSFGVGILIGSLGFTIQINKLFGRFYSLVIGNGTLGITLLLASMSSNLIVLCFCFILGGIGFTTFNINASALRAAATPPAFRARMAAGVAFLSSFLNPFATQGMGFIIEHSSTDIGVSICGLLIILSTIFLLSNRDAKSLLTRSDKDLSGAYSSLYPSAFIERG
ncbi:MFS transporter [Acinetobacter seifertii]|uniref:MFS transporter n=1 Tax=Acinetobacter seifertii TaxID=1530123 RepID=UPI000D34F5BB|nr:MFS transporter [Acinetobacter seifertii]PTV52742.1 hypothetical protein DBL04_13845 [Acinetobacter seifertii]